jgi:hypothetical protein
VLVQDDGLVDEHVMIVLIVNGNDCNDCHTVNGDSVQAETSSTASKPA